MSIKRKGKVLKSKKDIREQIDQEVDENAKDLTWDSFKKVLSAEMAGFKMDKQMTLQNIRNAGLVAGAGIGTATLLNSLNKDEITDEDLLMKFDGIEQSTIETTTITVTGGLLLTNHYRKVMTVMSIDFDKEEKLPVVNWVGIRLGNLKASDYENDIQKYGLELEDLGSMSEYDLDDYLSGFGISYLQDKRDIMREIEADRRRFNGGYSDEEMLSRLQDAMYGYKPVDKGNYDYDY